MFRGDDPVNARVPDDAREGALFGAGGAPFPQSAGQEWKCYENVRDCLLGKKPLIITGEWSHRPIHILDLAARSAKLDKA